MNAGAGSKPERPIGIEDRGRAAKGPAWSVEDCEHSVTRDIDESPIKACECCVGRVIVLVQKRSPRGVANLSSALRGAKIPGATLQAATTDDRIGQPLHTLLELAGILSLVIVAEGGGDEPIVLDRPLPETADAHRLSGPAGPVFVP
jgi:hypothetical protein